MKIKNVLAICLTTLFMLASAGCAQTPSQPISIQTPESEVPAPVILEGETYLFTDSCGREVALPKDVTRVAPSGPLAQIVLLTLCPDKLVGLASDVSDQQFEYIDKKYASLPVLGNFYADTLNLESVMIAKPQIVFDIGEPKPSIQEDVNGIQAKTGIPTVFIQMDMDSMAAAYKTLGEITGETEQAKSIAEYIENTLSETKRQVDAIPEANRIKVYYGQDNGLNAVVKGTVHSDVVDRSGGLNAVDMEESVRGGISEISMEQLLLWQPDVVLFAPGSIYDDVPTRAEWQEINAIKDGEFYEIPEGPYNWMGRPPSVNRVLGVKWLTNLLYPDVFPYDMVKETQEFYKLFYHCDVTEEQVRALLAKSTYKE